MKIIIPLLFFLVISQRTSAQGNCELYLENSAERKACEYGYKALDYKQGSRTSQLLFDTAITLNPNYAWAYYEKSVPYFKRGLLQEGILLLNKAIELDPIHYLTYRAYWYFQHQSYKLCQQDLERFYNDPNSYQKYTPGGGLDMRILLGITYQHLGDNAQAVTTVEKALSLYPSIDYVGLYDFHTLGVLYHLGGDNLQAKLMLQKAVKHHSTFADSYYYLALTQEALKETEEAAQSLRIARALMKGEKAGYRPYPFCFPVTLSQVQNKLAAYQ